MGVGVSRFFHIAKWLNKSYLHVHVSYEPLLLQSKIGTVKPV